MYRFYYDFIKNTFQIISSYMDTDGYIIELKNHDIYQLMKKNLNEFDTSNYPIDNHWGIARQYKNSRKNV